MLETRNLRSISNTDLQAGLITDGQQLERLILTDRAKTDTYGNRELSWLDFNERVLEIAEDHRTPLLERARFCAIFSSNLDEFFQVRVAGLQEQVDANVTDPGLDGQTPEQTLDLVRERVAALGFRLRRCVSHDLIPTLATHKIHILGFQELDEPQQEEVRQYFMESLLPQLKPEIVEAGLPAPHLPTLSLSVGFLIEGQVPLTQGLEVSPDQGALAWVEIPSAVARFVTLTGPNREGMVLVPIEDVISTFGQLLFPGRKVLTQTVFRLTRDADFTISDEADDLLGAVESKLRQRRFGEIVRIEVHQRAEPLLRLHMAAAFEADKRDFYEIPGLLALGDLVELCDIPGEEELRFKRIISVTQEALTEASDSPANIFEVVRERGDILVHHPYDSFVSSVEEFVRQAVADPDVVAIKQTVYRTSDNSSVVPSLIEARARGKEAVCLVEICARFDEQANIRWARALEEAGVQVIYGQRGLKTHAKCILVQRREGEVIRNYAHLGTGNYNSDTARLYTDFGLLTCDEELGADVADLFDYLTGAATFPEFRCALVAPHGLRAGLLREIERTIRSASEGVPCRITLKMNSLVDPTCIDALYRASQAGVEVDLNVRGICCLRPGLAGLSEKIRVVSIVGQLLEHSRAFIFERGAERRVFIGSADMMPRNLDTRVELVFPVKDARLADQVTFAVQGAFTDDMDAWGLRADGVWRRRLRAKGYRLQRELALAHQQTQAAEGFVGRLKRSSRTKLKGQEPGDAAKSPLVPA